MRALLLLLAALAATGCMPRLIPGTELEDTDDNHRVLGLIEEYRRATEARDAGAVFSLVAGGFYDDAGTADTGDDLDAAGLHKRLQKEWANRVKQTRLEIQVKKIFVEGDTARVRFFYTLRYQVGEEWKQELDAKEMLLKREGGVWKILSGV